MHLSIRGRAIVGNTMFRSAKVRFAVIALFAVAAVSLTAASAGAFSQGNSGAGEGGNSTFADPDEQVNIFGFGRAHNNSVRMVRGRSVPNRAS